MVTPVNAEREMPVPLDVVVPDMVVPHMVVPHVMMMPARVMPVSAMAAALHFDERFVEIIRIALGSTADRRQRARGCREQQRADGERRNDRCSHGEFPS
jgi:hypothetical protein